jgi:hypothetical protein
MDVSSYTEDEMFKFMGKHGKRFYWLTKFPKVFRTSGMIRNVVSLRFGDLIVLYKIFRHIMSLVVNWIIVSVEYKYT